MKRTGKESSPKRVLFIASVLVRRAARWRIALKEPDGVGDMAAQYNGHVGAPREATKMRIWVPLIHPGLKQHGRMQAESYQIMHNILRQQAGLPRPFKASVTYPLAFWLKIDGEQP